MGLLKLEAIQFGGTKLVRNLEIFHKLSFIIHMVAHHFRKFLAIPKYLKIERIHFLYS